MNMIFCCNCFYQSRVFHSKETIQQYYVCLCGEQNEIAIIPA